MLEEKKKVKQVHRPHTKMEKQQCTLFFFEISVRKTMVYSNILLQESKKKEEKNEK